MLLGVTSAAACMASPRRCTTRRPSRKLRAPANTRALYSPVRIRLFQVTRYTTLDIGFYGADGAPVSHRLMKPCPEKAENECPVYRADGTFVYAVETLKDKLPSGPLSACQSS